MNENQTVPPQNPNTPNMSVPPNQQVPEMKKSKFSILKDKRIFVLLGALLILLGSLILFFFKGTLPPIGQRQEQIPQGAIAKVGEEYIYQRDLDIELSLQPSASESGIRKILLDKLAEDSVIIQGAKDDKIVEIASDVYNSSDKDYVKRIQVVKEIKKKVEESEDSIRGTILTIWFANVEIGPLGYERAKQVAFEKISKLHKDVKEGKITIKQAGEVIQNDKSLAQIDKAYKTNAVLEFKANKNETITFNKSFNDALWKLSDNEMSEISTGTVLERSSGKQVDANYVFGQIEKHIRSGRFESFDKWLEDKRKLYEVVYY